MTDDPAWVLARQVCRTGYADLSTSAIESAHRDILDTFGCMLGGSGSPGIDELFAVISRWGGLAESRVLLRGARLPAPQAALLNASMGHALDFDDTLDTGGSIHPASRSSARLWPYATALAPSPERSCCWRLRWDSMSRAASRWRARSIAAGASHVSHRRLRRNRGGRQAIAAPAGALLAAFGIAYSHAAGNRQCILDGALTKRMQAGQAASAGIFSAVLAQTGFTGARNIFSGRFEFSSCISRTATMPRCCSATWARSSRARG